MVMAYVINGRGSGWLAACLYLATPFRKLVQGGAAHATDSDDDGIVPT